MAKRLQSEGISSFVLEYHVAGKVNFIMPTRLIFGGNSFPRMLADVQRAIQLVREHYPGYKRVGVKGFSAGGHLAMMTATHKDFNAIQTENVQDSTSFAPDFVAPIYPVVTMTDRSYIHRWSRRGLMGEAKISNRALQEFLSLELNTPDACCPVFLLSCINDPVVNYHNSILLDEDLSANGIAHSYILAEEGGHGFGASEITKDGAVFDWMAAFME